MDITSGVALPGSAGRTRGIVEALADARFWRWATWLPLVGVVALELALNTWSLSAAG